MPKLLFFLCHGKKEGAGLTRTFPTCTRQCVVVVGGENGDEEQGADVFDFNFLSVRLLKDYRMFAHAPAEPECAGLGG